jgi:hypothetical protein
MEQHAIPQQINSYEFKLVGDMTLKQFLKAAVGIVLAFLINSSKLIFFLKYPLVVICGGGGLLLAFVPFQDRPLEQWVMAFIKAIYSPTIYTYRKSADDRWENLGKGVANAAEKKEEEDEEIVRKKDNSLMREYIESLPYMGSKDKPINYKEETVEAPTIEEKAAAITAPVEVKIEKKEAVKEDDWRDNTANLGLKTEKLSATAKAVFGEIPMPDKPETPNMVVGMVTDMEGKIVEGAIVEIQDEKGNPSRVLKTNPLGQFRTTTPLANGKYLVITEKEDYNFDRVDISLAGALVDPIKIKAVT